MNAVQIIAAILLFGPILVGIGSRGLFAPLFWIVVYGGWAYLIFGA